MLKIKQHKFILFGIIVFGLLLIGMPPLYAGEMADLEEIAANRDAVMDEIVGTWSADANGWEEQLSINVRQADDSKLLALRNAESFDEVISILDGDTPESLGDSTADLVYTPVTPCKIVDTRSGGGGFISPGSTRNYQTYGSLGFQGGSVCSSPRGEPSAVHISMVAVTPNGQGNLKAHPYLTSSSAGLSVNFAPIGTNLANAGTVGVTRSSTFDISISAQNAGAHVTVQVLGYYYPVDEGDFKVRYAGKWTGTSKSLLNNSICTNCANVSIYAPGPGKIKVDAQAAMYINGHTTGAWFNFQVFIGYYGTNCTNFDNTTGYYRSEWQISGAFAGYPSGRQIHTVPVTRTFTVSSAGTYTYYLNANRSGNDSHDGGFWGGPMQAVYYPGP